MNFITLGPLCSMTCSCEGTIRCDPITGSCDLCPPGFIGENCENSCPVGFYGDQCQQQCNCITSNMESCDGTNGICFCKVGSSVPYRTQKRAFINFLKQITITFLFALAWFQRNFLSSALRRATLGKRLRVYLSVFGRKHYQLQCQHRKL